MLEEHVMLDDGERRDDILAATSNCPTPDCRALVVEYRAAGSVRPGHPEDWWFKCSRCGTEFIVPRGDFIFQSIPKKWLSAYAHSV